MDKHAYLIIAHKFDYTLKKLLTVIDDTRNDIYIHMDKKCKNFNTNDIINMLLYSNVYFVDRTSVSWGAYSLVNAKILLLKYACSNNKYQYYHFLSGQDLPIKNQDYIHNFFNKNNGYEFINFESSVFNYYDRVKYIYPFREKAGKKKNIFRFFELFFLNIQKIINFTNPFIKNIKFQKGSNWCSITDSFARYVISNEKWLKKVFSKSFICDELIFQTLIINSSFNEKIFDKNFDDNMVSNMRYIDWNRGNPYVWKKEDYNELINSNVLFARKFDSEIDREIIDKIIETITKNK